MTAEELLAAARARYEAEVGRRLDDRLASPVLVRRRDGRLVPAALPVFTPWGRLPRRVRDGWVGVVMRESPISEAGADGG